MSNYSGAPRPRWQRWLPLGLLGALLLLGASIYRGYGLTWDEPSNHYNGAVNLNYAVEFLLPKALAQRLTPAGLPLHPKGTWPGFDHGVAFELPAAALGRVLYPGDPPGYYRLRHLLVFLVFLGGLVVVYRLARLRYPTARWLPLLAAGALVLSPRFFAEAFYNGKDISFMVAFALGMLTLVRLAQRPTLRRTLVHALATAVAADVRLTGLVLLVAFTAAAMGLQAGAPGAVPTPLRRRLGLLALYAGLAAVLTVVGWPYLWAAPGPRLLEVLDRTTHFPWPGLVLYRGELLRAIALPWHYLPTWLLITTPLAYLVLAALGLTTGLLTLGRRGARALYQSGGWLDALLVAWLVVPPALIILNKSVVYDGWRHIYFVYPALLLLALRGVRALAQAWRAGGRAARLAGLAGLLLAADVARALCFIILAYPNQQVYFSCLPAPAAERLFERDYWGASYLYGLQWLLRHDPAPTLTVTGPQRPIIYVNWLLLEPAQRRRIRLVADSTARYYFTAYRWHPQAYADSLGPEVLAYRPGGGVRALSIFRRDSLGRPLPPEPIGQKALARPTP
ncbi:hypothetical protein [Hymenobacter cheonanensis]|uniref:hypothetical protein n=1 Tax=Hymenobacter sp. CA2-7 TaxID=3063993 RepID=UPI002712EA2C|nr:hypothetical protein [Hymenobacter sp. CA2-7]MDO7884595.1 hypothetical protein [Hymenobacter sp. CA2-7]